MTSSVTIGINSCRFYESKNICESDEIYNKYSRIKSLSEMTDYLLTLTQEEMEKLRIQISNKNYDDHIQFQYIYQSQLSNNQFKLSEYIRLQINEDNALFIHNQNICHHQESQFKELECIRKKQSNNQKQMQSKLMDTKINFQLREIKRQQFIINECDNVLNS